MKENKALVSWTMFFISLCFYNYSFILSLALFILNFGFLIKNKMSKFLNLIQALFGILFLFIIPLISKENNFEVFTKLINSVFEIDLRKNIINYVNSIHNSNVASFINLMMFNYKDDYGQEFYNKLIQLSIVHLIVVSGFHVNIICHFTNKIPKIGKYVTLFLTIIFCYFNNFSISMTRCLFFNIYNMFKITKKNKYSLTLLTFVFLCPNAIYNVGFCMSFICIRGLSFTFLLFKGQNKVFEGILSSILATIYLLPFLSMINNYLSLWSIFLSFLLSPIFIILYLLNLVILWIPNTDIIFNQFLFILNWFIDSLILVNINIYIGWMKNNIFLVFYYLVIELLLFFIVKKREEIWRINFKLEKQF